MCRTAAIFTEASTEYENFSGTPNDFVSKVAKRVTFFLLNRPIFIEDACSDLFSGK